MNSTLSPTLQAERRSWRYWFDDGLPSLLAGAGCLLFALSMLYPRRDDSSILSVVIALTAIVLYGLILLRSREILDWLKARITYPRTGYVRPPYFLEDTAQPLDLTVLSLQGAGAKPPEDAARLHTERKRRLWVSVVLTLVAVLPMMYFRSPWICAVSGLLLAGAMWFGGRPEQRLSWIVLGGIPLLGFTMWTFLPREIVSSERVSYFLAAAGVLFLVDGAASLLRFLSRNPRPSSVSNVDQSHD